MKRVLVTLMVALFATVVLGQTKTEIKPSLLPKCVHEYLTQNMKGFTIDKAFKQDNKGEITYIVIIAKGKDRRTLEFDKNCKPLSKATPSTGKPESQAKPPVPPKPVPLPNEKTGDQKKEEAPKK